MPQTKSAAKSLRIGQRRRLVNDRWRQKIKTSLHAIRDAIVAKDKSAAQTALGEATSMIDRAARHNVIHPNKAARKKSRLQKAVSKIS